MVDQSEALKARIRPYVAEGGAAIGNRGAMEAFLELRLALEAGLVRAAEPDASSPTGWRVNAWVGGYSVRFRIASCGFRQRPLFSTRTP